MFMTYTKKRRKHLNKIKQNIGAVVLLCLIPVLLIMMIFNFIKYQQKENIKHLNIAIVNQDKAAEFKGKTFNIGEEVTDKLSKDKTVHWQFVNANQAKSALATGKYAMVVSLPSNFSKNATTALAKNPKVSTLNIQTAKQNNYLTGMITQQVSQQMQATVIKNIQKAYDQAALTAMGTLADGVSQASDGVTELNKGAKQLVSGSSQLSDGILQYTNGTAQLDAGLNELDKHANELTSGVGQLDSGVNQLVAGSSQLSSGVVQYTNGTAQLDAGLSELDNHASELTGGVSQLNGGVNQLVDGSALLNQKLTEASQQIDQQLNDNTADLKKLKAGLKELNDGIQLMNTEVNKPENDNSEIITADMTQLGDHLLKSGDILQDTGNRLLDVKARVYDQTNPDSVASLLQGTGDQLTQMQDLLTNDPDFKQFLMTHMAFGLKLNQYSVNVRKSLESVKDQLSYTGNEDMLVINDQMQALGQHLTQSGDLLKGDITKQLTFTQNNTLKLKEGINKMAASDQAPLALNGANQALDTLLAGLNEVNTGLKRQGNTTDTMGAIQATSQIHDGLNQVKAGLQGTSGQLGLVPGLTSYTQGVHTAKQGSRQLTANNTQLQSGSLQLADGLNQVKTGLEGTPGQLGLVPGLTSYTQGVHTAKQGSSQLTANNTQLQSGSQQLATGLTQAGDGIALLHVKLDDGKKQVQGLSTGQKNVTHFVTPVKSQQKITSPAALINQFAPLVLTLVLFVGSLLTQFTLYRKGLSTFSDKLATRVALISGVVVAQSLLIATFAKVLGLSVVSNVGFYSFCLLVSAVFTLICLALDRVLGTVGLLAAFALLFVQLVITGGLFPQAMLSSGYQLLAKCLPATYSIAGLEQVINGTVLRLGQNTLILILFGLLAAGVIASRYFLKNQKNQEQADSQAV